MFLEFGTKLREKGITASIAGKKCHTDQRKGVSPFCSIHSVVEAAASGELDEVAKVCCCVGVVGDNGVRPVVAVSATFCCFCRTLLL